MSNMIRNKFNHIIVFFTTVTLILIFNSENIAQIFIPKAIIEVKSFELLDTNEQIVPAKLVGGENAILIKIVYPELAKRADIQGNVWCEFKIDENGKTENIKLLKDIGGGCGEQVLNAISKSIFIPGKLNGKNTNTKYRIVFHFEMVPINKNK